MDEGESNELIYHLADAIAKLSPSEREAILLIYADDNTTKGFTMRTLMHWIAMVQKKRPYIRLINYKKGNKEDGNPRS